jgi:hypothetical protein
MRIDRARATETIATITRIEDKDDGAELELAQLVTARLDQSGWDVESLEVLGSASAVAVRRCLDYLTYGLTTLAVVLLARSGFSTLWSLLACGLAVAGWLRLLTYTPRRPWLLPPLRPARVVIARRPSSKQGLPLVVIRASLGPVGRPPEGTFYRFRRLISTRPDSGQRDGAGIALLRELATGWASHPPARVETVLALVGGQDLDQAGDRALAEHLTKESPAKPTLLLTLDAAGIGKELLIRDDGRLVLDAAESLWVPHRVPTFRESRRVPRLPMGVADSEVWLGGSASRDGQQVVDLEALARAAQLVEEVVLRWGKRHSGSPQTDQQADERIASRSFQKPG